MIEITNKCNIVLMLILLIGLDVIGVLTGVGSERELEKNGGTTKLNVIALEAEG
jgi:hypothetical protein